MKDLRAFADEGLSRIRQAVSQVEEKTGCEVVTYIVGESDAYAEVPWKTAAFGAGLGATGGAIWVGWMTPWAESGSLWILLAVFGGLALGWAAGRWGPLRRFVAGRGTLERVADRAERAFLEEEVFRTRARNGLLVFLSLFERQVVILADEGLHRSVPPARWSEVAERVAEGMARASGPDAVVEGVEQVGVLLSEAGLGAPAGDLNELPDEPRLREE